MVSTECIFLDTYLVSNSVCVQAQFRIDELCLFMPKVVPVNVIHFELKIPEFIQNRLHVLG